MILSTLVFPGPKISEIWVVVSNWPGQYFLLDRLNCIQTQHRYQRQEQLMGLFGGIAQLAEHLTRDIEIKGSNPAIAWHQGPILYNFFVSNLRIFK